MYKEKNEQIFMKILNTAINNVQNAEMPVYHVGANLFENFRTVSMTDLIERSIGLVEKFEPAMESTEIKEKNIEKDNSRKTLVPAAAYSAYALHTIYVRDSINNQIDLLLENKEMLAQNGIKENDIEPFKKELKSAMDEMLKEEPETREIAEFIEKIDAANMTKEEREGFYTDSVRMIDKLETFLDASSNEKIFKQIYFFKNEMIANARAVDFYDAKGKNLDLMEDFIRGIEEKYVENKEINVISLKNLGISYDKSVTPQSFLESFNKDPKKLSKKELNYAHNIYNHMSDFVSISPEDGKPRLLNVELPLFGIDGGVNIVTRDEAEEAKGNDNKIKLLEARVVAKVLSGEKVTGIAKGDNNHREKVLINPTIETPEMPEFSLGNFFKWLWEKITSCISKEIKNINEMNDKFEKNAGEITATRTKMSFNEIAETNLMDKLTQKLEKTTEVNMNLDGPHM